MGTLGTCQNCGCSDNFLTTPAPCPTAVGCPTQECANTMFAQCIAYVGDPIVCGPNTVVPTDTNLEAALNDIVDYFCTVIANLPTVTVSAGENATVSATVVGNNTNYQISVDFSNIPGVTVVAGTGATVTSTVVGVNTEYTVSIDLSTVPTTTVSAGANVIVTPTVVGFNTDYEVAADLSGVPTTTVVAGTNVTVTSTVVGTNTEYTVNSSGGSGGGLVKIARSYNIASDPVLLTMTNADLAFCRLPTLSCNNEVISLSDFVYNVMYKTAPGTGTEWVSIPVGNITVVADEVTGDIVFSFSGGTAPIGSIVRITIIG